MATEINFEKFVRDFADKHPEYFIDEVIDAYEAQLPGGYDDDPAAWAAMQPTIVPHLKSQKIILAIKELRSLMPQLSLLEAKTTIDAAMKLMN